MVTGGGGSIGSELCRQIAAHKPKQLIIVDIYENTTYDVQNELKVRFPELDLVVLIASVRYFMTIPEAVSLVLQAGTYAKGGEIFVLDMGESVKILDLAKNLILLSGHKPDEDIHIIFTGLRPGEKLYEEMLMDEEGMQDTANNLSHIGRPIELDEEKFMQQLEELKEYVVTEPEDIRECVKKIVPTYHPELAGENK